jgi:hypothetical protein
VGDKKQLVFRGSREQPAQPPAPVPVGSNGGAAPPQATAG